MDLCSYQDREDATQSEEQRAETSDDDGNQIEEQRAELLTLAQARQNYNNIQLYPSLFVFSLIS